MTLPTPQPRLTATLMHSPLYMMDTEASSPPLTSLLTAALNRYLKLAATRIPASLQRKTKKARHEKAAQEAANGQPTSSVKGEGGGALSKEKKDKALKILRKRQGGVLGLTAVVLAFPYSVVPGVTPEAVVALSRHLSDPSPIDQAARKALSEFKRTHQDNWTEHKAAFTPEQLDDLDGLLVSPSYYA